MSRIRRNVLNITSCMAQNADATCRAIAAYIGVRLNTVTRFVHEIPWQQREVLFDRGHIQLCWLCGLPYIWKADDRRTAIGLCAAPVMRGARYRDRPVYFSDVVVHRNSHFHSFADLRGASWAFNESRSHSGYNVVRHHLSRLNRKSGYFGRVTESGAHQASLSMILDRRIDASAIDSTVLEAELRQRPQLRSQLRVVETLGPSPMPPWVMTGSVPAAVRSAVTRVLLSMHRDSLGRGVLRQWGISRFAAVSDSDYDPIRVMAREAADTTLRPDPCCMVIDGRA